MKYEDILLEGIKYTLNGSNYLHVNPVIEFPARVTLSRFSCNGNDGGSGINLKMTNLFQKAHDLP